MNEPTLKEFYDGYKKWCKEKSLKENLYINVEQYMKEIGICAI